MISEHPLETLVPVENAAMADRTIIQWDKDDLDLVGLLKVDILALGMLSALRRTFDLVHLHRGKRWTLADLPGDDRETYEMISRADTIGVFQIESRAQMAMLPRLRPEKFYDLVIEVAIVRPGPIQGDMVHPYLRRRNKEEAITYPPKLKASLSAPWACRCFRSRSWKWRSSLPVTRRARRTSCAARWLRGNATAGWSRIANGCVRAC